MGDGRELAQNYKLQFVTTGLLYNQIKANHDLKTLDVNWFLTYSRATRREPDTRRAELVRGQNDNSFYLRKGEDVSRFFQTHDDHLVDSGIDLKIKFKQWSDIDSSVDLGINYNYRNRDSSARRFQFQSGAQGDVSTTFVNDNRTLEQLLSPENIVQTPTSRADQYRFIESTGTSDQYTGILSVFSIYTGINLPFSSVFHFNIGLRYEFSNLNVETFDPTTSELKGIDNPLTPHNVLTALNMTWNITDKQNLRSSFSNTLARPDFRELTAFRYQLLTSGQSLIGNPNLKQVDIYNLDLRYEWFPSPLEVISLSWFYKYLDNPIEVLELATVPGSQDYIYANANFAHLTGNRNRTSQKFCFYFEMVKKLVDLL